MKSNHILQSADIGVARLPLKEVTNVCQVGDDLTSSKALAEAELLALSSKHSQLAEELASTRTQVQTLQDELGSSSSQHETKLALLAQQFAEERAELNSQIDALEVGGAETVTKLRFKHQHLGLLSANMF